MFRLAQIIMRNSKTKGWKTNLDKTFKQIVLHIKEMECETMLKDYSSFVKLKIMKMSLMWQIL